MMIEWRFEISKTRENQEQETNDLIVDAPTQFDASWNSRG